MHTGHVDIAIMLDATLQSTSNFENIEWGVEKCRFIYHSTRSSMV